MTRTPSVVESKISARNGSGAAKLFGERGLDQERLDSIRASLPDRPFMMKDVSWEDYQALTTILEEPAIRATYDRGYLELRMPLFIHEKIAAILSLMVHILCVEWDIDIAHARSTTFRRADLGKGVEPDNCYYVGPHADHFNNKETIDLEVDPAPDLVIETDITNSSTHRIPIYAAMGVREIWRWRDPQVEFLSLLPDGTHRTIALSEVLPPFSAEIANRFLQLGLSVNQKRFDVRFREFVRNELPRR